MNQRQLSKIQFSLQKTVTENQRLLTQNQDQMTSIQKLNRDMAQLQKMVHSSPLPHTEAYENPLDYEGKISQLDDIIQGKNYQILYLEESNQGLFNNLSQLQKINQEQQNQLIEKDYQLQNRQFTINSLKDQEAELNNHVEILSSKLAQIQQEKLELIEKNAQVADHVWKKRKTYESKMMDMIQAIDPIKQFLDNPKTDMVAEHLQEQVLYCEQSALLKSQQEQLESRNIEINRLRSVVGGNPITSQESYLKNTIKHLRGQLAKYNHYMTEVTQRSLKAESTIKQYGQLRTIYQKEISDIDNLKKKNGNLQREVERLKEKLKLVEEDLEREKVAGRALQTSFKNVLVENKVFHEMMNEAHFGNYQPYIDKYREEYTQRLQERAKHEQWANVDQLVEINLKLKRRLKIA